MQKKVLACLFVTVCSVSLLQAQENDGNHAYKLVHNLLSPAEHPSRTIKGGSYSLNGRLGRL